MALRCPNCGKEGLRRDARFCDYCGAKLIVSLAAGTTTPLPEGRTIEDGSTRPIVELEAPAEDELTRPSPRTQAAQMGPETMLMPETEVAVDDGVTKVMPAPPITRSAPSRRDTDHKIGYLLQKRYRLAQILGKGGFGAVYLAEDINLKRLCVVKQMLTKRRSAKELEIYRANFEREARLLVQLNHPGHPNIPEIYDYFFDESGSYLVMKYIEGRSLKEILDQNGTALPSQDVIRYGVDLCSALNYMHTHGKEPVMHRDIKPANIVLGDNGRIWLVDFGLAKAQPVEDSADTSVTQAAGSLGYTPLEQWLGEPAPASDIYALGATLHHLLTGLDPMTAFGGEFNIWKLQQLHGQFIPLRKINRELHPALEGIIASATGADPEQRPTALQLQQQFNVFISGAKDTPLFTFKSGETAKTNGQLVDLCDRYRREAQGYLYRGDFERWFRLTNRTPLAEATVQAISRARNQRDGLEKFLKLVLPNIFLRRLGRAGLHVARGSLQFGLSALVVILLLALGASYVARFFIQRSVANYPWDFSALESRYTETHLNQIVSAKTQAMIDRVIVDLPEQKDSPVNISANWGGFILLEFPLAVSLVDHKPHLQLTQLNGVPLYWITDNLSQGLNDGLATAFSRAPIEMTTLEIENDEMTLEVRKRPGLPPPTPTVTPTGTRQPTATPTSGPTTLLAIFNELDQAVTLDIGARSWTIAAYSNESIELKPGVYHYAVRTADGQLAAQGQKTWTLSAYKLYIKR